MKSVAKNCSPLSLPSSCLVGRDKKTGESDFIESSATRLSTIGQSKITNYASSSAERETNVRERDQRRDQGLYFDLKRPAETEFLARSPRRKPDNNDAKDAADQSSCSSLESEATGRHFFLLRRRPITTKNSVTPGDVKGDQIFEIQVTTETKFLRPRPRRRRPIFWPRETGRDRKFGPQIKVGTEILALRPGRNG